MRASNVCASPSPVQRLTLHDNLRKMLRARVFLDSSALTDLRLLLDHGVAESDCLVLMLTRGLLTRPWCLLEILWAHRHDVPILPLVMVNSGFDVESARAYIQHLPTAMGRANPAGLQNEIMLGMS